MTLLRHLCDVIVTHDKISSAKIFSDNASVTVPMNDADKRYTCDDSDVMLANLKKGRKNMRSLRRFFVVFDTLIILRVYFHEFKLSNNVTTLLLNHNRRVDFYCACLLLAVSHSCSTGFFFEIYQKH